MKLIWTSFKKYRFAFLFLFILFSFGIVTGFLFYLKQEPIIKETILQSLSPLFQENVFTLKSLLFHFLVLLGLIALSFCFLAVPGFICYLFFEGISIGFVLPIFFSLYKINGLFYFLLYFLFVKVIYLLLLFFLFLKIVRFVKKYVEGLRLRKYIFMEEMKYIFIVVFMILINDFVVYFGSNQVLSLLLG